MNLKGLLVLAGYFGAVGYAFGKTGMDKRIAAGFHREYAKLSEIQARALVSEMAARKAELASSES